MNESNSVESEPDVASGSSLVYIGQVEEAPGGAAPSLIRIRPQYTPGLEGIERHADLLILFWFHRLPDDARGTLLAHPRGDQSRPLQGVFSLRSPMRPNPIGLTRVHLLEVNRDSLLVEGLDALPGTPVLDIKPAIDQESNSPAAKRNVQGIPPDSPKPA